MLANRKNLKLYKLKSYKQAIGDYCKHPKDWQNAIQDKTIPFTKNRTWFF